MNELALRRPRTIKELERMWEDFWDDDARARGLAFTPRPSDVIITPFSKCGTTLLQHIAHGLRSGGSLDFDEINAVSPWIEIAEDVGWDLDAEQGATPRLFKSHAAFTDIPKGARYIVAFRHFNDAFVSLYRFFEGWFFEPGCIGIDELARWRFAPEKVADQGYFHHLASWWEQRANPDVLLLCYEDMIADIPQTVARVGEFLGIAHDAELFALVSRQASRDFMLGISDKFNERHLVEKGGARAGLPPPIDSKKVTAGARDDARYRLRPELREMFAGYWREIITARFGFANYEALRRAVAEENYKPLRPAFSTASS